MRVTVTQASSANRQIARAAGTVMIAFAIGNLTGLVRQALAANAFGTSAGMEAFNAANRVSETLFNLIAGGALSSAFIPTFTGLLARQERPRAWRLASAVSNLLLLALILLALLAALFAPWIVRNILAPGFAADPAKEALTIHLLRLMLPSAVIFGLSGLVMSILNSHQRFLLPALAPSMYQLGMIIGILFLAPALGIAGLGWGVLIGASLHLLVQLPQLFGLGGRYTFTLGGRDPSLWTVASRSLSGRTPALDAGALADDVWEVLRLMGPRLLGVAVVQLNFWVNTRLASRFPEGSVTGLTLGFALMLMPQAAIAQSIAIAAMPTFSAQAALGKLGEMRASLAASLRGALLLSIPAMLGLILLRRPVVALLYQRGEFGPQSTELVAWALLWYVAGLVGHSLVEILARAFYALHDTKTPVFIGIGAMSLNVVFSYLFSALFLRLGWMPHGGLALANSTATALEAVLLLFLMRRRLGGLEGRRVLLGAVHALAAALLMSLALAAWLGLTAGQPSWLVGLGGVLIGGLVFALAALALRLPEALALLAFIRRRVGR